MLTSLPVTVNLEFATAAPPAVAIETLPVTGVLGSVITCGVSTNWTDNEVLTTVLYLYSTVTLSEAAIAACTVESLSLNVIVTIPPVVATVYSVSFVAGAESILTEILSTSIVCPD